MPVTDQTTSNSSTGNGVTTIYPYTFKILDEADLLVEVDGVAKTLTTHYTVSGVGNSGGGNVTFVTAPALDAVVVVSRDMDVARDTDYQENGDLLAATLDEDLDRVTMLAQQIRQLARRAVKLPISVTADQVVTTGSTAAERANKVLGFDSAGDAELLSATDVDLTLVSAFIGTLLDDTTLVEARETLQIDTLDVNNNLIINGSFEVNQRASTSVANDTYCLDRWYVLTESGSVTIAQSTDPEVGAMWGITLTQPDASPKRMGIAQIVESRNCRKLRSAAVALAARVKESAGGAVRYAILDHDGTADTITRNLVSNWASTTYASGGFFAAGFTVVDTGTVTPGAGVYGDMTGTGTIGAAMNNLILFVWTDAQVAQNVTLDINRVQMVPGTFCPPFKYRNNEIDLCQRYYQKFVPTLAFPTGYFPGMATTGTDAYVRFSGIVVPRHKFSLISYSALADFRVYQGATNWTPTSISSTGADMFGAGLKIEISAGYTVGGAVFLGSVSSSAWLAFSMEL